MKKILLISLLCLLVICAFAAVVYFGKGNGAIRVGDRHMGLFRFEVYKSEDQVKGSARFEVMNKDKQVLMVIGVPKVMKAQFTNHSAEFGGKGIMRKGTEERPVLVHIFAADAKDSTEYKDKFAVKCFDGSGNVVFSAGGIVQHGDIIIGKRED